MSDLSRGNHIQTSSMNFATSLCLTFVHKTEFQLIYNTNVINPVPKQYGQTTSDLVLYFRKRGLKLQKAMLRHRRFLCNRMKQSHGFYKVIEDTRPRCSRCSAGRNCAYMRWILNHVYPTFVGAVDSNPLSCMQYEFYTFTKRFFKTLTTFLIISLSHRGVPKNTQEIILNYFYCSD